MVCPSASAAPSITESPIAVTVGGTSVVGGATRGGHAWWSRPARLGVVATSERERAADHDDRDHPIATSAAIMRRRR